MEYKNTRSRLKQRQEQKNFLTKQQQWNNDIKVEKNTKFQKFTVLADKTLHIDELGRQFTILKYITMEDVLEVLQDQGKSIKLKKKWEEYVKMAQNLGIQNLKDMVDNADLILDALRGPPNLQRIKYLKSKQKFYWDQCTNERYKNNPDFKIVQAEYQLRTNNKCIILEPIQEQEIINFSQGLPQQYLIKDILIKYNKKFDKFPEANPSSIIKKTALEIGMQTVKQIQKEEFKPILLKGLNPNDGWDRAIFIKSNTLGFINTITQERVDQHPFLNKLRQEFREAVKFFNYDIVKEVSETELKNFLEYDQNDSDKMDTRMKQIKTETEKTAYQIGMQNFDDMLNFKNILFEGLKPPYGWKKVVFENDPQQQVYFMQLGTKKQKIENPQMHNLKKQLIESRGILIKHFEKISQQRIINIFNYQFLQENMNSDFKLIKNNSVQLKKHINQRLWKVAALHPILDQNCIHNFTVNLQKMDPDNEILIGLVNIDQYKQDEYTLSIKNPKQQTYLIDPFGKEIIQPVKENDYQDFIEKTKSIQEDYRFNVQDRFSFISGDEIEIQINFFKREIYYYNLRNQKQYTQQIRRNEQNFSLAIAAINPLDEIQLIPQIYYPIHFCLVWEHPNIDLDLEIICLCKKTMNKTNIFCQKCGLYFNTSHDIGDNPIEHAFLLNQPNEGDFFEYAVVYNKDYSQQQNVKNVQYSISVLSGEKKQSFVTLQRTDGFIYQQNDKINFKFVYDSKNIQQTQEIQNKIIKNHSYSTQK